MKWLSDVACVIKNSIILDFFKKQKELTQL